MLNSILIAAVMLMNGPSVSNAKNSVEQQFLSAPVASSFACIGSSIEKLLIEKYAVQHWGISIAFAWQAYFDGVLKIKEITPGQQYELTYQDGILQVLVDPSDI